MEESQKEKRSGENDEAANPFTMPRDEDIFRRRDDDLDDRNVSQQKYSGLNLKEYTKPRRSKVDKTDPLKIIQPSIPVAEHRRERENMAEFIAKKREMFLVQMSLDTKREEIRKLEEKAQKKEEALKKSELMLEEDAIRFDAFLKENDRKAHEAIKRHEKESKEKGEKVAEIKKLNAQIAKVRSEMSKYSENLEDCLKYKAFLDSLTPPEWTGKKDDSTKSDSKAQTKNGSDERKSETGAEEPDMYFTETDQLLDTFAALEERNLFLIQNSQETEEALEELRTKFKETKYIMEAKTDQLQSNIDDLSHKIKTENTQSDMMKRRISGSTGSGTQDDVLSRLGSKIATVYEECGFNADANPDPLSKLAEIETRLESLISTTEVLPESYIEEAEKKKEVERRDRVRKERLDEKNRQNEERLAKSLQRSKAEVQKKTGKPIMFRSAPIKRKKKKQDKQDREKELTAARIRKYFEN